MVGKWNFIEVVICIIGIESRKTAISRLHAGKPVCRAHDVFVVSVADPPAAVPMPPQRYRPDPDNEDLHIERPSHLPRVPDARLANPRARRVPDWESANQEPFVWAAGPHRDLPVRPGTPGRYPIRARRTAEPRRVPPLQPRSPSSA